MKISSMFEFFLADASTQPTVQPLPAEPPPAPADADSARRRSSPVSTTRFASRSHLLPTMTTGVKRRLLDLTKLPDDPDDDVLGWGPPYVGGSPFASLIWSRRRFVSSKLSRLSMLYTRMNRSPTSTCTVCIAP